MPLCRALVGLWCILMALPRTLSLSSRDSLGRETGQASKEYFDSFYVERVVELVPRSMSKRSVNSNQNSWFNEKEKLIINGLGKKFVLILSRSKEFIAPGFVVQRMTDNTTFIEEFKDGGIYSKCFYSGTVHDNIHSVATLSLCGALSKLPLHIVCIGGAIARNLSNSIYHEMYLSRGT
ncbi:hypothetical protein LOTGIDRAFT_174942 [Lottia gigantea]|uniref:Peptidase M12B propeptide domain-containing protein n=1 Tax=Lottia gigantea TaxID=225164 RepID=V4AR99_LOTGI|nr:hypothetical protein LOTGIDRAFT_174942 [Lottia gigantea]ESO96231.1 hypothetical protein LOTGIDRAFT_174942 [Lottia gigantea]